MTLPLIGKAENGVRADLVCSFYTGTVGVRDRGEMLDLAWADELPTSPLLPATGTLDGKPITITTIGRSATVRKMVVASARLDAIAD